MGAPARQVSLHRGTSQTGGDRSKKVGEDAQRRHQTTQATEGVSEETRSEGRETRTPKRMHVGTLSGALLSARNDGGCV